MNEQMLIDTASKMVKKGKGILAADESIPTAGSRLQSIGVKSTFETRNEYRDMLLSAKGMEDYISGVILFDETLKQSTTCSDKTPFVKLLNDKDVIPGIKVDTGAKNLAAFPGEKITEGLDGLRERLREYFNIGARFAKWRAVITIDQSTPSDLCILANAHALARYASLCQESNIVPIVEPEVLMNGSHTIEKCYEVTNKTLNIVFEQLNSFNIMLEGIVLKPNMIISGLDCDSQANVDKVSEMTVKCLESNVPETVPGIAFLSGGQTSDLATAHLNSMNKKYLESMPWNLTFSYGRALQTDALKGWNGNNREIGQANLIKRAKENSLATKGVA
jgi:fructose-bisphosphate aldolase class I